jgi:tripartite-type tricarboxylate transporter receptor subunit TctC
MKLMQVLAGWKAPVVRGAVAVQFALGCTALHAYPERPVKIVVPWPAGGAADAAARVIAQQLATRLSQPVMVEYKPGANGMIGADAVARAPADGYTILFSSGAEDAINPHVYPKMTYDLLTDFAPITPFAQAPLFLASRNNLGTESAIDVVGLLKKSPGKFTYASWGVGSLPHVGFETIVGQEDLKVLHVPFVGGPPAFNALMSGQVDVMLIPAQTTVALKDSGKLKIYAVAAPQRVSYMPNTPTLKELGYDVRAALTYGFLAPAKTPAPVIARLHAEIFEVVKRPEVRAALEAQGALVYTLSSQDYALELQRERARFGAIVKRANIRIDK